MMKYVFIAGVWLACLWIHTLLGWFVLPSPVPKHWYGMPLLFTHIVAFICYTAYCFHWAYITSERNDESNRRSRSD